MMQVRHRPAEGAANVCWVRVTITEYFFFFYLTFILSVNWVQKAQVPKAEQTGWWTERFINEILVCGVKYKKHQTMWNIKMAIASNKYESIDYNKWHHILKYEFILDVESCYVYSKSWNYPLIIFQKMANIFLPDKAKCIITWSLHKHFPSHSKVHFLTVSVSVAGAIWEYECRSQN